MPQWDVYPNPVSAARHRLPYVVVLQHDLIDSLPTRLVAPLSRSEIETPRLPSRLAPLFDVAGERLMLKAHEIAALPSRLLREPVASLREQSHRIVDALDAVVAGV